MESNKNKNIIFVVGVSLLIILMIYTFTGISGNSIFAYPGPNSTTSSTDGYPGPTAGIHSVSGYPAPNQTNTINRKGDKCIQPLDPAFGTLKVIDPCATPRPLPTPTPSPTPNPGEAGMLSMTSSLTVQENGVPVFQMISPGQEQIPGLTITIKSLTYNGPLPSAPPAIPNSQSANADLVDNWDLLAAEGFEDVFPQAGCIVSDHNSDNGYERYWGADDGRPLTGLKAGWPAKGGADGVDPTGDAYPDNLDSWLVCGPYDLSEADKFIVDYSYWHRILDFDDFFFTGVSTNGSNFQGFSSYGTTPGWIVQREHFQGVAGDDSVWVAWVFRSDDDGVFSEGVWMDDLSIWRYNTPAASCGNLDPGDKGIVLPPYDPTANGEVPIIRPGDTLAVDALKAAGVNWVRLGFIHKNGSIDWQGYDRMVDTLCANGISVAGLVNNETLLRQDYDELATANAYRQEFVELVEFIADYYEGRITYWEVWNEPNLPPELGGAFVNPIRYAPLLDETYQAIKAANTQAQVLFGGLASAWGDSNDYFTGVYNELDNNLGGARPFDYFAVHPYANELYGPNPEIYMYANLPPTHNTIVDKFMETMFDHTDENKAVWITEVGWNSSKSLPNRPVCHDPVLVTEAEQAAYLKPMFDTLFNEVTLWNQSTTAVEKVIWYQYMDIGIEDPCTQGQAATSHVNVPFSEMTSVQGDVTWLFGLYRSDKVTPKPVQCAYLAYPNYCQQTQVYLPAILR